MNRKALLISLALVFVVPVAVMGQSFINSFVSVCDPATPANCIKPTSGGAINIGGTVPLPTGSATAALQTSVGATAHSDALAIIAGPLNVAPTSGAMTVTPATVGTSSALALAAGSRKYLFIQNESATANVACATANGTAALNTAGSFMLPPYGSRTWEGSATPSGQINCIASVAATPVTIEAL